MKKKAKAIGIKNPGCQPGVWRRLTELQRSVFVEVFKDGSDQGCMTHPKAAVMKDDYWYTINHNFACLAAWACPKKVSILLAFLLCALPAFAGFEAGIEPDGNGGVAAKAGYSMKFDQHQVADAEARKELDGEATATGGGAGDGEAAPEEGGVIATLAERWPWILGTAAAYTVADRYVIDGEKWIWQKKESDKKEEKPQQVQVNYYGPVFTQSGNGNTLQYNTGEGAQTAGNNGSTTAPAEAAQ